MTNSLQESVHILIIYILVFVYKRIFLDIQKTPEIIGSFNLHNK